MLLLNIKNNNKGLIMSIIARLYENLNKANDFFAANTKLMNVVGNIMFAGSVLRTGMDISGYSQTMGVIETLYAGVAGVGMVKLAKLIEEKYSNEDLQEKGLKSKDDLQLFEVNTSSNNNAEKFKDKIRDKHLDSSMEIN